uniref:Uncharacterized protein n=1 Tax=Cacopsylla melanoneura TaxID=428564 RepID=A0A8D8T8D2_9HEMI
MSCLHYQCAQLPHQSVIAPVFLSHAHSFHQTYCMCCYQLRCLKPIEQITVSVILSTIVPSYMSHSYATCLVTPTLPSLLGRSHARSGDNILLSCTVGLLPDSNTLTPPGVLRPFIHQARLFTIDIAMCLLLTPYMYLCK